MISDMIGNATDTANKAVVNDAKKTVDDLQTLLAGPDRAPIDIEKEKAVLTQGVDLSTPGGGLTKVPSAPTDAKSPSPAKPANVDLGTLIEFIHFGIVHHDASRSFQAPSSVDDTQPLDPQTIPGRAVYFRAAIEREAVLLAGIANSVVTALADKEKSEGNLGDLMKLAADLLGGAGGTATSAASADMKPFLAKINTAWDAINEPTIKYADLHDAGIKLHEVRANLTGYLLGQLGKPKTPAPAAPAGLLSHLPIVGDLTIPGPVGQVVTMFRKVGGKLHDVEDALIYGLTLAMQPAMEGACHQISLDAITNATTPIYPVWFDSMAMVADPAKKPFSDIQMDDPLQGGLKSLSPAQKINKAFQDGVGDANSAVNKAVSTPMDIIDFLSKEVKPVPGTRYLDDAFQASTGATGALGGSEKLGEIAVAAFFSAITDEVPEFLHGFVETFVGYVFAVCVEFLRAVYRVLCSLPPAETISTDELVAAGSTHILTHLVDFLTAKLGLDDLLKNETITIPPAPSFIPKGINWPDGKLSAAPIIAALKKLLIDKASPYLKPVVDFAMSGLATRLNAQRSWASGSAMTMEAHLGQLPTELALLFRNLFKPLWSFINDTCMEVVSEEIGKALGPAASIVGVAGDGLGMASSLIGNAERKAAEAQSFAKNVEDKAKDLISKLSAVTVGIGNTGDLSNISSAANALKNAVTSNPFDSQGIDSGKKKKTDVPTNSGFPGNRKPQGQGLKIDPGDITNNQWDDARVVGKTPDKDADPASDSKGGGK